MSNLRRLYGHVERDDLNQGLVLCNEIHFILRHRLSSYVNMAHVYRATLNSPISMEIISMGHTNVSSHSGVNMDPRPRSSPKLCEDFLPMY